jgi:pimeloyl-ACP methyl ester carboxylesterase
MNRRANRIRLLSLFAALALVGAACAPAAAPAPTAPPTVQPAPTLAPPTATTVPPTLAPTAAPTSQPQPTQPPPTVTVTPVALSLPTPTPAIAIPPLVDVGGYKLHVVCFGTGSPTVVLESGMGDTHDVWSKVILEVKQTTRVCAYDRAGLGQSDPSPTKPRTSLDMVKDLHTLLTNARIEGPFVLVGHSIGGFIVRLYASQYPDEVVGMVLVDSAHPDQSSRFLAVLPPPSPDELLSVKNFRESITAPTSDPSSNPEGMDIDASAAQVRATGPLGNMPLVVLTHSPDWRMDPDLPNDIATKVEQVWQDLQVNLLSLSSNSTHIIASKAGHYIQVDEPQLVIDAILRVVDEAKNQKP